MLSTRLVCPVHAAASALPAPRAGVIQKSPAFQLSMPVWLRMDNPNIKQSINPEVPVGKLVNMQGGSSQSRGLTGEATGSSGSGGNSARTKLLAAPCMRLWCSATTKSRFLSRKFWVW